LITSHYGEKWKVIVAKAEKAFKIKIDCRLIDPPGSNSSYVDLPIHRDKISSPFTMPFSEAYGISPDGAVLVRPDGYVAWREKSCTENSENNLKDALSRILCRGNCIASPDISVEKEGVK
jgi:putative polyketide hydroxylase